jgi:hypothetical protein
MRRLISSVVTMAAVAITPGAWAGDAETSAMAGSGFGRPGTAAATAAYEGDLGFARTRTRSGPLSVARGVAVGVDEDGLSLSVSNAIAARRGLALATNFNIEIERDGDVSFSTGRAVSRGPLFREASVGGFAGNNRGHGVASSFAAGNSDPFGRVHAVTHSVSREARPEFRRLSRPVIVIRGR